MALAHSWTLVPTAEYKYWFATSVLVTIELVGSAQLSMRICEFVTFRSKRSVTDVMNRLNK